MEKRKIKVGLKVFDWLGQKALSQSDLKILESAWSKVRINYWLDLWHADIDPKNVKGAL